MTLFLLLKVIWDFFCFNLEVTGFDMRKNVELEEHIEIEIGIASPEENREIEAFMKAREKEANEKEMMRLESYKNRGKKISESLKKKSDKANGEQLNLFD